MLVHGGGAELSGWCERLGLVPRFEGELRVTDAATLEVATAVLAGLANKRWVATLRAAGVDAVGLAALDGGVCDVVGHPDAATLGEVGAVQSVNVALLDTLLRRGSVPVLASIGAHGGRLLNLNADDLAAALASALGAPLVLLTDHTGADNRRRAGAVAGSRGARSRARALRRAGRHGGEAPGGARGARRWCGTRRDRGMERTRLLTALVAGAGRGTVFGAAADASRASESVGALHG